MFLPTSTKLGRGGRWLRSLSALWKEVCAGALHAPGQASLPALAFCLTGRFLTWPLGSGPGLVLRGRWWPSSFSAWQPSAAHQPCLCRLGRAPVAGFHPSPGLVSSYDPNKLPHASSLKQHNRLFRSSLGQKYGMGSQSWNHRVRQTIFLHGGSGENRLLCLFQLWRPPVVLGWCHPSQSQQHCTSLTIIPDGLYLWPHVWEFSDFKDAQD